MSTFTDFIDDPRFAPIRSQLTRRTIREFDSARLDDKTIAALLEVAKRTPTSTGMQFASIIDVEDENLRQQIAKLANQPYLASAPHMWIFVSDVRRLRQIVSQKGDPQAKVGNIDQWFQGVQDCVLTAQSVSIAAEALGLGACLLGSPMNDAAQLAKILELPELVFPVLGVMFGKPAQDPQMKPRMPMELRTHKNHYSDPSVPWVEALADYDQEMTQYYDLRAVNNRLDSYTDQVLTQASRKVPGRLSLMKYARQQGFEIDL